MFLHTLNALGQERPTTCAIALAADDAIMTVAWRDANGTTVWDGVVTNGDFKLTNAAGQLYYFKRSP